MKDLIFVAVLLCAFTAAFFYGQHVGSQRESAKWQLANQTALSEVRKQSADNLSAQAQAWMHTFEDLQTAHSKIDTATINAEGKVIGVKVNKTDCSIDKTGVDALNEARTGGQ